jgi:hypothetical protein
MPIGLRLTNCVVDPSTHEFTVLHCGNEVVEELHRQVLEVVNRPQQSNFDCKIQIQRHMDLLFSELADAATQQRRSGSARPVTMFLGLGSTTQFVSLSLLGFHYH